MLHILHSHYSPLPLWSFDFRGLLEVKKKVLRSFLLRHLWIPSQQYFFVVVTTAQENINMRHAWQRTSMGLIDIIWLWIASASCCGCIVMVWGVRNKAWPSEQAFLEKRLKDHITTLWRTDGRIQKCRVKPAHP